jgi:hypothetical protein
MGMDSREVTPELTRAAIHVVAEVRSFERAEITVERVLGHKVSRSTIRRLAQQVGGELAELAEQDLRSDKKEVVVPEVAVVSSDGGRIRTRQAGQGRGVVLSGEKGWRETKNASFERMSLHPEHSADHDPCSHLPSSFRTTANVAGITEKPVSNVDPPDDARAERVVYRGPRRVLRTAISSMACSDEFGPMMEREAKRRRFYEAPLQAFLGDGLNWNWSIWKKHFPTFVPILDFIHAIHYVFASAMALDLSQAEAWATYVRLVTLCWQGGVDTVIDELTTACQRRGIDLEEGLADDDPHQAISDAVRYLRNNHSRMDYPRYRRLGLPVTIAPMESLIKQVGMRVKGTEMFWDDPEGGEYILQIRAAALSQDQRLDDYLMNRPGRQFVRRTTQPIIAA